MKLVCLESDIISPTIDQISNEVSKLNNKDYFHTTLFLENSSKRYIRVHLKSANQYILIYCDGLSDSSLREENAILTHKEIIMIMEKAMKNDFSWVNDFSWLVLKGEDSLNCICKSIIKITIVTLITISISLLSVKFNFDFYLGLLILLFPIMNKFIHEKSINRNNVLGAQKRLNNLWESFILPVTFLIISRDLYFNSFWIILSYIFIIIVLLEIYILLIYQFKKPFSRKMNKPAYYIPKKRNYFIPFLTFRVFLITMWLIASRTFTQNI